MYTARANITGAEAVSIDWTSLEDPEGRRVQHPTESFESMKPWKDRPSGKIGQYCGTRFDILARWMERKGIDLDSPCEAFTSGHNKMLRVDGVDYLTWIDGLIYTKQRSI